MRDLRVSVTDRCNFRCLYCLPETEEAANFYRTRYDGLRNPTPANPPANLSTTPIHREWKPKSEILRFEEITRVVRIAVDLGIEKVRVTGGDLPAVNRQGAATRLRSLELGSEPAMTAGNCDSGYSCAYSANISWKSENLPNGKETDPRAAFERLGLKDALTAQRSNGLFSMMNRIQQEARAAA